MKFVCIVESDSIKLLKTKFAYCIIHIQVFKKMS